LSPLFRIGSLGVKARVFIFGERAPPSVGEIEDRHVKNEHGVVPVRASSKKVAHSAPEIIFTLSSFHYGISCPSILTGLVAGHHVALAGFWSASFEG